MLEDAYNEETKTYTVNLKTADYPTVEASAKNNESITVLPVYNDEVKIIVKSEDGKSVATYTIKYNKETTEVDKTKLQEYVNSQEIASAINSIDKYTVESYQVFKEAYDKANEVLANADATQEEVNQAYQSLKTAYENLEERVIEGDANKFELSIAIDLAKTITDEDLKKIKQETNSTLNKAYNLFDNELLLSFTYGEELSSNTPDYYSGPNIFVYYVELEDDNLPGKIIGNLPSNDRELVIHKFLADYIIKYGVIDSNNELYKPENIEELVNSKHELKLGDNTVTISGVVDDDNSQFIKYKNKRGFNNLNLRDYYSNFYASMGSTVYVKGFTKTAKLNSNKELILNKIYITPISNNSELSSTDYFSGNLKNITEDLQVITIDGLKTINHLNKDEIVLSLSELKYYDNAFETGLDDYLRQNSTLPYEASVQTYTSQYLKDSNNLSKLKLKIRNSTDNTDIPVTIIGITTENDTYVSNQFVEEYNPKTKLLSDIYIYDDDIDNLKEVFKKLKYSGIRDFPNGTYYTYEPFGMNQNDLKSIIGTYKELYKYILVLSLIFVLFAILLFSNFIGTSISYSKKEIGILRALGARNKDTLKIFAYESIIIGLISWIISIIGWNFACDILNESMFGNMYYSLNGIIKSPLVPIGMFIFTIILSLVITFISVSRVNKIKPIDAILNK